MYFVTDNYTEIDHTNVISGFLQHLRVLNDANLGICCWI